jgi:hypothetical protein
VDLRSLPEISDGANLPPEALAMRDQLLNTIVGQEPVADEASVEVLG